MTTRFSLWLFLGLMIFTIGAAQPACAQMIIRDTEIESDLDTWLAPVFQAAGLNQDQVKIILVQDPQVNAFVAGGANIFIYTGLLQKTESPAEVIGVVAHELGHITGGHLIRGKEQMENASYESMLGMILGAGAAIASGDASALGAITIGSGSMAQRRFLTYSRAFESSADQAALKYLNAAKMDPQGLESFLKKLESQELRPTSEQSEYVRTHPLTRDRIDMANNSAQKSTHKGTQLPAAWTQQHKMMLAKIMGFVTPEQVAWTYDDRDQSSPAITARAIAAYRTNQVAQALKLADVLVKKEPSNPYFYELKGQMLMDFGRVKDALPAYQKAINLKPDAALIRIALAHAQMESAGNNKAQLQSAIENLQRAAKTEPKSPQIHRFMATAYGRVGDETRAKLHLAEEALLQGKKDYAKKMAQDAQTKLPRGSADWLRASDILLSTEEPSP